MIQFNTTLFICFVISLLVTGLSLGWAICNSLHWWLWKNDLTELEERIEASEGKFIEYWEAQQKLERRNTDDEAGADWWKREQ